MSAADNPKTVLIVDDSKFTRIKLKSMLEKNGYEVTGEAEDGRQAVDMCKELKPAIVTMDITMPEMDGLSSLKQIMDLNTGAKVVMISALGQKQKVLECIKAGAKDFIIKPFEPDKVVTVLNRVMEK